MWWKSSVWSIWRSRIGVEQIGSRCSFFVQKNIKRKLLKGGRIINSSTFERLSCVMTRSHRFELCKDQVVLFVVVSSSKLFDMCKCEHMQFVEKPQRPPSCHRQLFQMMVFGQTISIVFLYNDGNAICLYYIYCIYIGISLRISCDSKPTFSWNQKNGSLIPSILFRDISKADSFPSPVDLRIWLVDTGTAVDGERLSWRLSILG